MLYQTEGIVLSQEDQDENDKVITLLTKDEGLIRAKVKGARKAKSKLSSPTQPFTHGLYQLFRGRSLDRVIQVVLRDAHQNLYEDYRKMVYASYLSEMAREFLPERESNEEAFYFFSKVLHCLEEKEDPWPVALWAQLGFLTLAGFSPDFSTCYRCKSQPKGNIVFVFSQGAVACEECAAQTGGNASIAGDIMKIQEGTRKTLDMLLRAVMEDGPSYKCPSISARGIVRKECSSLLERYVTVVLEKRLRSLPLVESIENENGKV